MGTAGGGPSRCRRRRVEWARVSGGRYEDAAEAPNYRRRMTLATHAEPRRLGSTGPTVFPVALGCMGMSGMYGPADETESIATIHAALDAGVTLLDTGDYYGAGHNELLIGRALRDRRDKRDRALVSVKFGALRAPDGS